jgi:flavodoxin
MQKTKRPANELAEMIRDGLAEEGFDIQVNSNPRTGWDVVIRSDGCTQNAQLRAEAMAVELRQSYDLEA